MPFENFSTAFYLLAWLSWQGFFAWLLLSLLVCELWVTAWDFVEEDRSRRLSAQERVTHFILTLVYGGFLALLLPNIMAWSSLDSALTIQSYGIISWILSGCGLAVFLLGIRNWLSANRLSAMKTNHMYV